MAWRRRLASFSSSCSCCSTAPHSEKTAAWPWGNAIVISVNPPRNSLILLEGNDVLRQIHSPRALSNSIEARYSSVSYLKTGNGLSGGQRPASSKVISACCTGDVRPAMLGLGEGRSISSPLAAPLQRGKNLTDQVPLSDFVAGLSAINSQPGPARLVACIC